MANGEVLDPHDTSGWRDVDRTALSNAELIDLVFDWSPIRGHKAAVGAVGVKIISDQLSWPSRQQLPAELLKVPNLHVILPHRANALHAVRPLVRALAAGIWLKPVTSKAVGYRQPCGWIRKCVVITLNERSTSITTSRRSFDPRNASTKSWQRNTEFSSGGSAQLPRRRAGVGSPVAAETRVAIQAGGDRELCGNRESFADSPWSHYFENWVKKVSRGVDARGISLMHWHCRGHRRSRLFLAPICVSVSFKRDTRSSASTTF